LQSAWANAQVVNKCVDAEGRVTFSDKDCPVVEGTSASRYDVLMNSPVKSDSSWYIPDYCLTVQELAWRGKSPDAGQWIQSLQGVKKQCDRTRNVWLNPPEERNKKQQ